MITIGDRKEMLLQSTIKQLLRWQGKDISRVKEVFRLGLNLPVESIYQVVEAVYEGGGGTSLHSYNGSVTRRLDTLAFQI